MRGLAFALALPEPTQPCSGAEFEGPGALPPGQRQGLLKTRFRLGIDIRRPMWRLRRYAPRLEKQRTPHPMQLGLPQERLLRVKAGQRLAEHEHVGLDLARPYCSASTATAKSRPASCPAAWMAAMAWPI